jgi:tetratricopeptide (TPR) repeat protein
LKHDPERVLTIVGNLALFEGTLFFEDQNRFWVKEAIASINALPMVDEEAMLQRVRLKAKGWLTAGRLAFNWGGMPAAREAFSESIALARKVDEPFTLAVSLSMRGLTWQFDNNVAAARADAEESIALFLDSKDKWGAAMGMMVLSWVEDRQGNKAERDRLLNEVHLLALAEETSHPMLHYLLMGAAMEARGRGNFVEARSLLEESLRLTQHWRGKHTQLAVESELAHIARQSGDLEQAKHAYWKTIHKWKETGHRAAIAHQLECLAFISVKQKQLSRAIRLMGAAEALRETVKSPMTGVERTEYDHEVSELREQFSPGKFSAEWTKGRSMTMDQAIDLALVETDDN